MLLRALAFTLVLAAVACGPAPQKDPDLLPFPAAGPDAAPDPSKPGPYPVGVRTVIYEDTGRRKPDGGARQIVTEIWYPATQATRGGPGVDYDILSYFPPEQRAAIADAGTNFPLMHTDAVRDAEPAKSHGPFPVVVFSHGQAALRWQSTYYTVPLASHGYVVLAPDHEEGTLGDVVRNQLQNTAEGIVDRPADVLYLLNRLHHLRSDDFLVGLVDAERFGVTGHSFGGLTSLRVAAMDSRVKVIVPQAPTSTDIAWLGLADAGVGIPVMLQAAHEDKTLDWDTNAAIAWKALQRPRWLFDVTHGGHFTFSVLCELDLAALAKTAQFSIPGTNLDSVLNDGCGPTAPKAQVAEPLINHFAIGTFNAVLRNSPGSQALLDQAHADQLTPGVVQITADP